MNIICLTPVHASFHEGGCVGKCVMSYFKHFSSTTNAMFLQGSHKKCSLLWASFLPPCPFFLCFPLLFLLSSFLSSFSLSPFFSSFLSLLFSLPFFLWPLFILSSFFPLSSFFLCPIFLLLFLLSLPIFLYPPFFLSPFLPLLFSLSSVHQIINSTMGSASVDVVELLQLFWTWSVLMHIFLLANEKPVAFDPLVLYRLLMVWEESALWSVF